MKPEPVSPSPGPALCLPELLSRVADGDGDDAMYAQACTAWQDNPQVRQDWHTYQLIGEALRSEELSSAPARDAAFLSQLRARLATESVPVAPVLRGTWRQARWFAPVALAAGFVAVAAVLVVVRTVEVEAAGAALAQADAARATDRTTARAADRATDTRATVIAGTTTSAMQANGQASVVLRDAQLDRYLHAHRAYSNASPSALPGGVLRVAETVSLER